MRTSIAILLLLLSGCRKVEPAPADLDGLLRWLWTHHEDADLAEAIANLEAAVGEVEEARDGELTRLLPEEIPRTDVDPAAARGLYLVNAFPCEVGQLEAILVHLAQDELYEGVYDAYERGYTTDAAPFEAGEADRLGWDVTLEATLLGSSYTERLTGGVRRAGGALVQHTWMTEPADFGDANKEWPQDWQIEVYYPSGADVVHVYGFWREMALGSGLDTEDDTVARVMLNNLVDWDEGTATLCAERRP